MTNVAALEIHQGDGAKLMELWRHAQAVVLVDATSSGKPAGTIVERLAHEVRSEIVAQTAALLRARARSTAEQAG